jgi:DNA primase
VESIRGALEVFLVEGPFDLLTLLQWGYPTVALMWSHVKDELVDELRDAERIYVVTHPDEAGRRVAGELAEIFGERTYILQPLPGAKDPNELAKQPHARETFAALVQKATHSRAGLV